MPGLVDWQVLRPELEAIFRLPAGDYVRLPCDSFQADFDLSGIPTARLSLAPGRDARDLSALSAVHTAVQRARRFTPVRVFLRVRETSRSAAPAPAGSSWPEGWVLLFDGDAVGVGEGRQLGRAGLVVGAAHWLSKLAFSSAVSRSSTPTNPTDFSFGTVFRMSTTGVSDAFALADPTVFHDLNLTTDFWAKSLLVWFRKLCAQDRLEAMPFVPAADEKSKNAEALTALGRFEGADTPYLYAGPLALDLHGMDSAPVVEGVRASMGQSGSGPLTLATTTLWDKLAGDVCPMFGLAVCPAVDRAALVPFVPGLRSVWTTVRPDEYYALRRHADLPRPLRGVGVVGEIGSLSGGALTPRGIGAFYEPADEAYRDGMVVLRELPPWLRKLAAATFPSRFSAAPAGVRSSAARPGAAPVPAPGPTKPEELYAKAGPVWRAYAQYLYATQVLSGRQMVLSGRLRLDVAPGSTVAVRLREDDFVGARLAGAGLAPAGDPVGCVLRVTVILDRAARRAETHLHLGHVREPEEAAGPPLSVDRHPLWKPGVFAGAPLVDAPEFDRRRG